MKKVIEGVAYDTETAERICEQSTEEVEHEKGVYVRKTKQLFKTGSGKYFFFIKNEFTAYVDINSDDLNPKFERRELEEKKLISISYELALQFASEINSDSESKELISKQFPELSDD